MDQLTKENIFGQSVAHIHVIEFQKRGLPHAHILLILHNDDRLQTAEAVDNIVCAELPPDPEQFQPCPNRDQAKRLQDIVLKCMLHGPCGQHNATAPCMQDGYCTKHFPKSFNTETLWDSNQACPTYRRRSPQDNGRSFEHNGRIVDNSWVVPYSPYLCLKYEAHINVEICASALAAKYLFKYVYKSPDRAMMQIKEDIAGSGQKVSSSSSARDAPAIDTDVALQVRNEISEYQDMRSIGSSEACWRIFGFDMRSRKPSVIGLRVHLPT